MNLISSLYSASTVEITDEASLQTAVASWCNNPTSAEATYGHIRAWNTGSVTSTHKLFYYYTGNGGHCSSGQSFNGDVSGWDVSSVTSMSSGKSGGAEL